MSDTIKHIVSGGFWHDPISKKWVCAGSGVRQHFSDHPELWALVGMPDMAGSRGRNWQPGTFSFGYLDVCFDQKGRII